MRVLSKHFVQARIEDMRRAKASPGMNGARAGVSAKGTDLEGARSGAAQRIAERWEGQPGATGVFGGLGTRRLPVIASGL
jgi:hypothetical protein